MELNWKEDNNLVRKIAKILLGDTLPNGEPVSSLVLIDAASRAELQRWADMSDAEFEAARQSGDTIHIDVDDEIKRITEEYFRRKGQECRIELFQDAEWLLCELEEKKFDIYVLDVEMPGKNGLDAARGIRRPDGHRHESGRSNPSDSLLLPSEAHDRWNPAQSPLPARSPPSS